MNISAKDVKDLREKTGLGMMECKKALEEAEGDADLAITNLRKNSALKAEKKSSRAAVEGIILSNTKDSSNSILIEINCETDFVAKDANFLTFAGEVLEICLNSPDASLEKLLSDSLEEKRQNLVQKIGENIVIRRKFSLSSPFVYSYIHGNKKIGVLVSLDQENEELGKDLAMHIAASNPLAISPEEISEEIINKEKEIIEAQVSDVDKPPEIVEKMTSGRLKKFLSEVSLIDQPFVKDPSLNVSDLLKNNNNSVLSFTRYEVGEGIEVEKKDFAEEVQAQLGN